MSDTSGSPNSGSVGRSIRTSGGGGGPPMSPRGTRSPDDTRVWSALEKEGILQRAFDQGEIARFIRGIVDFVELSVQKGQQAVADRFGVELTDGLWRLQRSLLLKQLSDSTPTDFRRSAERAFHVGSTAWATKLVGVTNPQRITIKDLIASVQKRGLDQRREAAVAVLTEFGRNVITQGFGTVHLDKDIPVAIQQYETRLKEFLKRRPDSFLWESNMSDTLVKTFRKRLV